jgi:hypothetical protein
MTHDRPGSQSDPSRDPTSSGATSSRQDSATSYGGQVQTQERNYQPLPAHTKQSGGNKKYLFALLGAAAIAGVLGGLLAANSHGAAAPTAAHTSHPSVAPTHAAASPSAHVIGTFTGTGDSTSPAFKVTSVPVIARWGYSCAAAGKSTGKFAATMAMTHGINGQTIANASGSSGTAAAVLHPSHIGSMYHVSVTATCPWRVIMLSR